MNTIFCILYIIKIYSIDFTDDFDGMLKSFDKLGK